MEKKNDTFEEIKKFIKQEVKVKYHESDDVMEITGQLRFINFQNYSCVIMTKKEKIIIKNIISIVRKRSQPTT